MNRIGIGYDIHRLEEGRPLILGGVHIPHDRGPVAFSDGDVLVHAIIDALLGALALGDIGSHFPDTDSRYSGVDSLDLLRSTLKLVQTQGYKVANLDSNIILQEPKLRPYIDGIRQRLAEVLDLRREAVSVKAKTHEEVGPEGRQEAISAQAIVLLETTPPSDNYSR